MTAGRNGVEGRRADGRRVPEEPDLPPGSGSPGPTEPGPTEPGPAEAEPGPAEHGQAEPDEVFAALADPTRRQLLDALARRGEATATVLAAELPVSRQAVVKHLAVLDRAGLVAGRREGREMRYVVRPQALGATARLLDRMAAQWDARLAAIKRIAESGGA